MDALTQEGGAETPPSCAIVVVGLSASEMFKLCKIGICTAGGGGKADRAAAAQHDFFPAQKEFRLPCECDESAVGALVTEHEFFSPPLNPCMIA